VNGRRSLSVGWSPRMRMDMGGSEVRYGRLRGALSHT